MDKEWNAQNGNENGEELALGDTVPHAGIGFLEAFAGDACGGVDEGKKCGKDAGGSGAPEQADGDERYENEQSFAHSLEQLGGVARVQELPQRFADGVVFAAEAAERIEVGLIGLGEALDAVAGGVFDGDHGLNLLLGCQGEELLGEFHGHGGSGIGDAAIEFAVDEIGHAATEQADGADDGNAIEKLREGGLVFPREPDAGEDDAQDAAVGGHAALPHAQHPGGVVGEPPQPVFRQPVEEEFAESATNEDAEDADGGHEIAQFLLPDAEEFLFGEPLEGEVAQHKAGDIGQSIPAQGKRGAGNIDDDGIEMVDICGKARHDRRSYSTGRGRDTR